MWDVLVIGAGPAGSHLAWRLTELGHRVMVVEEHDQVGEPACCTGILGRDCQQEFSMPAELVYYQTDTARFYTPAGQAFDLRTNLPQAYIVDRAGLDRALAHKAQQAGAEYLLASPVQEVKCYPDKVQVKVGNNGHHNLEAQGVVLACGASSSLPLSLGLGRLGDWVLGAQAEVEGKGIDRVEIYMGQNLAPGFFAWLVPTTAGRGLAGLMARRRPGQYLRAFLARLHREGKIDSPQARLSYGRVPLLPPSRTYAHRVLAVGDAAGQVKPSTAGGIYYGLLGAELAAQVLHAGLELQDLSASFLSRYQKAWKKRLGRELQIGYWARRFYEGLEDQQIEDVVRWFRESGFLQAVVASPQFSFDWHSRAILQALGPRVLPHLLRVATSAWLPFQGRHSPLNPA